MQCETVENTTYNVYMTEKGSVKVTSAVFHVNILPDLFSLNKNEVNLDVLMNTVE